MRETRKPKYTSMPMKDIMSDDLEDIEEEFHESVLADNVLVGTTQDINEIERLHKQYGPSSRDPNYSYGYCPNSDTYLTGPKKIITEADARMGKFLLAVSDPDLTVGEFLRAIFNTWPLATTVISGVFLMGIAATGLIMGLGAGALLQYFTG